MTDSRQKSDSLEPAPAGERGERTPWGSPAPTVRQQLNRDGAALVRIAVELREFVGGEDVPPSVLSDIATVEKIGRWLAAAIPISTLGAR